MPALNFYRRRWYPNRRWRRRRYFRRRRFGQTVRRRFRRRNWVRRRRHFRFRKRKLPAIRLKQWQPKTVRKCHIKGNLCLLTCGRGRINNNFIITSESYVPTSEPGGGSFSILQFTTRVLYDEYLAGRNWWTKGNTGLPLQRYIMAKLKFYRSSTTDYIVTINRTPPFEVSLDSYLSTQPTRHLMNHNSFIVPKIGRGPNKKTYIKKKIFPPALLLNKWYFQQDMYNIPMFMLTVSATTLDQMFAPEDQISTNVTIYSLNTNAIQRANWEQIPYSTKAVGTENIYLWGYANGHNPENLKWEGIYLLANTKTYTEGKPLKKTEDTNQSTLRAITEEKNKTYWGNPFTNKHQHKDITIYYGKKPDNNATYETTANILPLESLYVECRYNPFKDKGKGNKVYLVSTDTGNPSFLSIPNNSKIVIDNLPLWLIFWGWGSWLEKSRPIAHLKEEWQVVIQSPYIYPKLPCYVLVDKYFREPSQYLHDFTQTDLAHWHIKYEMQQEQLEIIAQTGPGAPKINNVKQIECHCNYNFYLKWGGNPAPMETITDPSEQEKFPDPSNQLQGLEVSSPDMPKEYYLYHFDEKRSTITKKAAKRLKSDLTIEKFFTDCGAKDIPIQTQEESTSSSEEEEIQTSQQTTDAIRLQLLKQRFQYRQRLKHLLKTKKLFPL
nr:MAG: ORF1 [TTV-like mini virus]